METGAWKIVGVYMYQMQDHQIKEILVRDNEAFQSLNLRHQECEQQLRELDTNFMHTEEHHIEEVNLKKKKLRIKDSMEKYISEYKRTVMD